MQCWEGLRNIHRGIEKYPQTTPMSTFNIVCNLEIEKGKLQIGGERKTHNTFDNREKVK